MITALLSAARRAVVLAVLVASGLGLALGGSAAASAAATVYGPTAITEFTMVSGTQWAAENEERLGRTGFVFGDDGSFAMVQPDGYPQLVGTWNEGGFQGTASTSYGSTGGVETQVQGTVSFGGDGTATVRLTYTAGSVMAATVNGTSFGSNSSKAYHATVELQSS